MNLKTSLFLLLFPFVLCYGQEREDKDQNLSLGEGIKIINSKTTLSAKSPLKSALYSAVIPGLGQAYNKKYWKVPVVYTVLGIGAYYVYSYNDNYQKTKDVFIRRLNGETPELFSNFDIDQIGERQNKYKNDRDYAILITAGLYLLNIIDALVDGHLSEFDMDDDLAISIKPVQINFDLNNSSTAVGLQITHTF